MSAPAHLELVRHCEEYVRAQMGDEPTGHDWWHAVRVRNLAVRIARDEGLSQAEIELAEITGLLHDLEDEKFSGSETAGPAAAAAFLRAQGCDEEFVTAVADIISKISFHGAQVEDKQMSLVGQCVRDADRLDAIGAIGIARAFAYGGHFNRPIHDPEIPLNLATSKDSYRNTKGATINHFYEKLLLLRDRMTTTTGRRIAEGRHREMEDFLASFSLEWDGLD